MASTDPAREPFVKHATEQVRRAFAEFLTIPTLIIAGFLLLSAGMYQLDILRIERGWSSVVPGDHQSIRTLLGTIATSIITVTSITFSLLLLAVQQGAASLTAQVYDQFLRRRANQAYFGFFTGLALYAPVALALVHPGYTPVYSAILGFFFTMVALYLLILLIYSTIDQMRPVMIVHNIRDHTIAARAKQCRLLERTSSEPRSISGGMVAVHAEASGYFAMFDPEALAHAAEKCGVAEIVLLRCVGDYVSFGEKLADVRMAGEGPAPDLAPIRDLLPLQEQRDLDHDAAFGIDQLLTIGWTAASTSKSNPHPSTLACEHLRDLVASWYPASQRSEPTEKPEPTLPLVYVDNVPRTLLWAFESMAVVASESMQHQTLAHVYRALALAARRMPHGLDEEIEGIVNRSLSCLGDQVLTAELATAIDELADALREEGMEFAPLVRAKTLLAWSRGRLGARSTRVKAGIKESAS